MHITYAAKNKKTFWDEFDLLDLVVGCQSYWRAPNTENQWRKIRKQSGLEKFCVWGRIGYNDKLIYNCANKSCHPTPPTSFRDVLSSLSQIKLRVDARYCNATWFIGLFFPRNRNTNSRLGSSFRRLQPHRKFLGKICCKIYVTIIFLFFRVPSSYCWSATLRC